MRILFSWLRFNDLEAFRKNAPAPVVDEIEKLRTEYTSDPDSNVPLTSLLDQALFEKVYLFHHCKLPFEKEFMAWLRPDIEFVFLEIKNINDSVEIIEKLHIEIAQTTNGFKKDFGILRNCGTQAVQDAFVTPAFQNCTCYYEIKNSKIIEIKPPGQDPKSALKPVGFENIIGASQETANILHRAGIAAKNPDPVLITGERGTGKKELAKAIALASSKTPLEVIKCIASNYKDFDQELLGTEHSDGILKKANKGTLVLDGIDKCNFMTQLLLLKTLKDYKDHCEFKTVGKDKTENSKFRIIATATRNLLELVKKNEFLEDLYYMLAYISIETIPLCDQTPDILLLAHHFLEEVNKQHKAENSGYVFKTLSSEARKALALHLWPGNISELRLVIRQAVIFSNDNIIEKNDLPIITSGKDTALLRKMPLVQGFNMKNEIDKLQRDYIERALKQADNKKTDAAKALGLGSYQALDTKMKSLGMKDLNKKK